MTIHCAAVFEKGVLRPLTPPGLTEGEEVEVIIRTRPSASGAKSPAEMLAAIAALPPGTPMAGVLAAIAALPLTTDDQGFSGQDHDKILYGEKGAR